MLLTNHALTGITLGAAIDQPVISFPISIASHLILDSTPHGSWRPGKFIPKKGPDVLGMSFRSSIKDFLLGSLDFGCAIIILGIGLYIFPAKRVTVAAGWLGAVGPDLLYLPEIFFKIRLLPKFKAFHSKIQWSESGYGIITEAVWAYFLLHTLHLISF